jgi:hypothetical protein
MGSGINTAVSTRNYDVQATTILVGRVKLDRPWDNINSMLRYIYL